MTGIQTSMGTISLFTIAMMIICIISYNKKIYNNDDYYTYSIYIPFFSFAVLFAFVLWHPQWVLYLIPFLTLAFYLNENTNTSLILHSAMSIGYIGTTVICFTNNVDSNLINKGIFSEIFGQKNIYSISGIFNVKGILGTNFFNSLFVGSILLLVFLYYPTLKNKEFFLKIDEKTSICDKLFIWARPLTLLIYILPTLIFFFI